MHPIVYGIPNCDTVKKARAWLTEHGVQATFHDFKKQGVSLEALADWAQALGWDRLINRQGTTWRKLSDEDKALLSGPTPEALQYVQAHASLIKQYQALLSTEGVNLEFKPEAVRRLADWSGDADGAIAAATLQPRRVLGDDRPIEALLLGLPLAETLRWSGGASDLRGRRTESTRAT
mgnify:CR=1 FL=1